jgi:hypothetical protein
LTKYSLILDGYSPELSELRKSGAVGVGVGVGITETRNSKIKIEAV